MDHQNVDTRIKPFSRRNISYKLGSFGVLLSFILYTYTFISDNWITIQSEDGLIFSKGLWSSCHPDCSGRKALIAIEAMACISMVGYLCTIGIGFLDNCRLMLQDFHSRRFDWTALFTGTVGIMTSLAYFFVYFIKLDDASLERDFQINIFAVMVMFVATTLIGCNNRNPQTAGGRVISTREPQVVHYSPAQAGQPGQLIQPYAYNYNAHMAHVQAHHAPWQQEPFLPQYQPSEPPPPYSLPPAYPGESIKA